MNRPRQCATDNTPCPEPIARRVSAARDQSTDSFHLAMLVAVALLVVGAAVNAVGIRDPDARGGAAESVAAG